MSDIHTVTTFLGWCTVLNIGVLLFTFLMVTVFSDFTKGVHSAVMGISEEQLDLLYFNFLGYYKLAVWVFNIVPYFALKLMV